MHNILLRMGFPVCWRFVRVRSHHNTLWRYIKFGPLEGAQVASTCSYSYQPQRAAPELRFSATLGQEPEVELNLVQ